MSCADGSPDDDDARFAEVFSMFAREYVAPSATLANSVQTQCQLVRPGPAAGDCGELIDGLITLQPTLDSIIIELEAVRSSIPAAAHQEILAYDDLLHTLYLLRDSDRTLISGWQDLDYAQWAQGWELRSEAIQSLLRFDERMRDLADQATR